MFGHRLFFLTINDPEGLFVTLQYLLRHQKYNYIHILMVLLFGISWAPHFTYNTLRDYDALPEFVKAQPYFYHIITHGIAMSSLIWNPLLYTVLWSQKFRNICKNIANVLPQWWKDIHGSSSTDSTPGLMILMGDQYFPMGCEPQTPNGFLGIPKPKFFISERSQRPSSKNLKGSDSSNKSFILKPRSVD